MENLSLGKKIVFTIAALILLFAMTEIGLRVAQRALGAKDPRLALAPYQNKEWAPTLIREMDESAPFEFREYVGWVRKPYKGTYVNVDEKGIRRTWNPEGQTATTTLFAFGGSTMWGSGDRDEGTIASQISKELSSQGYSIRVVNQGEGGYAFTQEIVKLLLLLRAGERPDYAIFYDGVNDVAAAYESGEAGKAINLPLIQDQLKAGGVAKIKSGLRQIAKEHCVTCSTILSAARLVSPNSFRAFDVAGSSYSDEQLKALADATKEYYGTSLALLDRLSQTYGFKYLAFWQPNLFFNEHYKDLSKELSKVDSRATDEKIAALHRFVNAEMPSDPHSHFFNISQILNAEGAPAFLDHAHLSEEGNAIVAREMVRALENEYLKPKR